VVTGVLTRLLVSLNIGTMSLFVWEESQADRVQQVPVDSVSPLEEPARRSLTEDKRCQAFLVGDRPGTVLHPIDE